MEGNSKTFRDNKETQHGWMLRWTIRIQLRMRGAENRGVCPGVQRLPLAEDPCRSLLRHSWAPLV
jgi:hypothetical protein